MVIEDDAYHNRSISELLNLSIDLDFMNEQKDVRIAEEEIKERGLEKEYFNCLSGFEGKKIASWQSAQTKRSQPRARAISKLLRSIDSGDNSSR